MVVVMQRCYQRDLAGHLLEKGGWEHVPTRSAIRTAVAPGNSKSGDIDDCRAFRNRALSRNAIGISGHGADVHRRLGLRPRHGGNTKYPAAVVPAFCPGRGDLRHQRSPKLIPLPRSMCQVRIDDCRLCGLPDVQHYRRARKMAPSPGLLPGTICGRLRSMRERGSPRRPHIRVSGP